MGRFDKIAKLLGIAVKDAEKLAPEVLNTLEKVNTPELSTVLKGGERAEYLKALDAAYGDSAKRAKDAGFGDRTWYHGSTVDIPEFKNEAKGLSTGAQSAKKGFFFASDPSTASDYAELARDKGVIREGDKVTTRWLSDTEPSREIAEKKLKELQSEIRLTKPSPLQFGNYNMKTDGVRIGGNRFGSIQEIDESIARHQANIKKYPEDKEYLEGKIKALNNGKLMLGEKEGQLEQMLQQEKQLQDTVNSAGQQVGSYRLKGQPDNIHVKNYKGQSYRDSTYADEMSKAQADDKTGVLFKNTYDPADPNNRVKQDIAAVFEPEQIRSTNAAFDPRFKKSSNVLAGLTGLGLFGATSLSGNNNAEAANVGRFSEIAKLLGTTIEDVSKMAPEEIKAKLLRSGSETIKDSKALGNTTHVIPDATERAMMENLATNKPQYGSVHLKAAAGIPTVSMGLGDQLKTLKDEVAKPLSSRWEQLKSSVYEPLSKQMNLTKDPEQAKTIESALSMVGDPINLLGGVPGAIGSGMQVLGSEDEEDKKK